VQQLLANLKWLITKTIHVYTAYGIPIHVHLLLLIVLPFFVGSFVQASPDFGSFWLSLIFGVVYIGILFLSVLLHELGHAWGAHLVGGRTHQVILLPVGGVAMVSNCNQSPRCEFLVTALGPAVSVLLAVIGWIGYFAATWAFGFLPEGSPTWIWGIVLGVTLSFLILASVNTGLALFNLLVPIFPMDSARLIRSFFSMRYNPAIVTLWVTRLGIGLSVFVITIWFLGLDLPIPYIGSGSFFLSIIALLGIQVCLMEQERIQHQDVYDRQDNWAGRIHFYDSDAISLARRRAESELGRLGFLVRLFSFGKSPASNTAPGSKPKSSIRRSERVEYATSARVIDISADLDPEKISDLEQLYTMMKSAANSEDFKRAALIQRRINTLEKGT
jgi:Zn-dependent protease